MQMSPVSSADGHTEEWARARVAIDLSVVPDHCARRLGRRCRYRAIVLHARVGGQWILTQSRGFTLPKEHR